MTVCGLLVRLEARRGREKELEQFLESVLPLVHREHGTLAWFAVHFSGRQYGIFDAFADDSARLAHLQGAVAQALVDHAWLFASPPRFQRVEVLADKLPTAPEPGDDHKALLLTVMPREGREAELAEVLRSARDLVLDEPDTTAWFALRFDSGELGIFDAFPNRRGRLKHLVGKVPRQLVKNTRLLGGMPSMAMLDIQAESFVTPEPQFVS